MRPRREGEAESRGPGPSRASDPLSEVTFSSLPTACSSKLFPLPRNTAGVLKSGHLSKISDRPCRRSRKNSKHAAEPNSGKKRRRPVSSSFHSTSRPRSEIFSPCHAECMRFPDVQSSAQALVSDDISVKRQSRLRKDANQTRRTLDSQCNGATLLSDGPGF